MVAISSIIGFLSLGFVLTLIYMIVKTVASNPAIIFIGAIGLFLLIYFWKSR